MKNVPDLSENVIKQLLKVHLISEGWSTETYRNNHHGLDVIAIRGDEHWVIMIKGEESADIVESFILALGSIVQVMEDPKSKYSIALPDIIPYRRLWERLPVLVKQRTAITALFVNQGGSVVEIPG